MCKPVFDMVKFGFGVVGLGFCVDRLDFGVARFRFGDFFHKNALGWSVAWIGWVAFPSSHTCVVKLVTLIIRLRFPYTRPAYYTLPSMHKLRSYCH